MKIGFDLQGGDNSIEESIEALKYFVENNVDVEVYVYLLEESKFNLDFKNANNVKLIFAKELINHDDSILVVRRKKDSTLIKALNDLNENKIDALVSAGASGPLVSASFLIIKPIKKDIRPAFSPMFLGFDKKIRVIVDAGANIDVNVDHMIQFAKMGEIFYKIMTSKQDVKIGLLNIGKEEKKGTNLYIETHKRLKNWPNFVGNIEPNFMMNGDFDVLVSDGFNGNIISKSYEGAFSEFNNFLKIKANNSFKNKFKLFFVKDILKEMKELSTSEEVSGAVILGLNKLVFKAHGSSNRYQLRNALSLVKKLVNNNLVDKINMEV